MDFSENYASQYQDEIQSDHWHYTQMTICTCAICVGNSRTTYEIISEYLSHNKISVYKYMKVILDYLTVHYPDLKDVNFSSDLAASQYKRYLFVKLTFLQTEYDLNSCVWSFFATSQGKKGVDGIGGTIKQLALT